MKTVVAILNWNGKSFLQKFLPLVVEHTAHLAEIAVIDNASTDDSVRWISENYPRVTIVQNSGNFGFAGGYNTGLSKLNGDYYVLLNSDVAVTDNWLEPMLELIASTGASAVQPKIRSFQRPNEFEYAGAAGGFIDRDGFVFCRGRLFDHFEIDSGQYKTSEIFWASGACLLVDASLYRKTGGLDEDFFAHMEEIDLCWRLKNLGHSIYFCNESTVYHVGGGTLNKANPRKTYLNFRNNLFLLVKNHFSSPLATKLFYRMMLDGLAAFKFLFDGQFAHFLAVFRAHLSFYRQLRKFLNKRRIIKSDAQNPNLNGLYTKSVVWDYFVRKKNRFSDLEQTDFIQST